MKKLLLTSSSVLTLLAAPALADHTGGISFTDAFDVSQGTIVTNNSPEHPFGIVAEDMFGGLVGAYAPERGHTIFNDAPPPDGIDFVEFTTSPLPFALDSVHLIAVSDGPGGARGLQSFTLLADLGAGYVPIGTQSGIFAIQSANNGLADLIIPASAPAGTTLFRAEFVGNPGGSRIIELDAQVVPEPATASFLAFGLLAFAWRRRA